MKANTPIAELTVSELQKLIRDTVLQSVRHRNVVYGIQGIADLFGVSLSTAKRIKATGRLDSASLQYGRTIVLDADKAIEAYNENLSIT